MRSLLALLGLTMLASLSVCAGADVWVTVQKAAEGTSTDGKGYNHRT